MIGEVCHEREFIFDLCFISVMLQASHCAVAYDDIGSELSDHRRLSLYPLPNTAATIVSVLELFLVVLCSVLRRIVVRGNHAVSISKVLLHEFVHVCLAK